MEAWDIIVIGDGPAALRASAVAAKEKASTLMMSSQSLGIGDTTALDGIAAPLKESTTKSHRDDTIRAGGFLCDQDIVSQRITEASRQVDLLERWGVIFRRDADGIPLVQRSAGHELPRLAGAGDAMVRETQQVLEEQCMKHGVVRRGDQIPPTHRTYKSTGSRIDCPRFNYRHRKRSSGKEHYHRRRWL